MVQTPANGAPSPSAMDSGRMVTGAPAASASGHGIAAAWLHAVDPDGRLGLPDRGRDARQEPAAADARDDDVHVRQVGQDLETGGALARDDVRVIERRHVHRAALRAAAPAAARCVSPTCAPYSSTVAP